MVELVTIKDLCKVHSATGYYETSDFRFGVFDRSDQFYHWYKWNSDRVCYIKTGTTLSTDLACCDVFGAFTVNLF